MQSVRSIWLFFFFQISAGLANAAGGPLPPEVKACLENYKDQFDGSSVDPKAISDALKECYKKYGKVAGSQDQDLNVDTVSRLIRHVDSAFGKSEEGEAPDVVDVLIASMLSVGSDEVLVHRGIHLARDVIKEDENPDARLLAIFYLGSLGLQAGAEMHVLLAVLDNEAESILVRRTAARALGQISPRNPRAVSKIRENLEERLEILPLDARKREENDRFIAALVEALGEAGPMAAAAVPKLAEAHRAVDLNLAKLSIIWALGQIDSHPEVSVPIVVSALSDKTMSFYPLEALARLSPSSRSCALGPSFREAVEIFESGAYKWDEEYSSLADAVREADHRLNESWICSDSAYASIRRSIDCFIDAPIEEQAIFLGMTIYIGGLFLIGALFAFNPGRLALWAMERITVDGARSIEKGWSKKITYYLLFAHHLGNRAHALDGYLRASNNALLNQTLHERPAYRSGGLYYDLDENKTDVEPWLNNADLRGNTLVWIHGPGGCGKTTLGIELTRHWHSLAESSILASKWIRHPRIPILIDDEWEKGGLIEHIATRMRVGRKRPTSRMVKEMASSGRLLIVIDGLSELNVEEGLNEILHFCRDGVLTNAIVTSRHEPPESIASIWQVFRRGPLPVDRFPSYVNRRIPEEAGRHSLLEDLREFSRNEPLPVIFLKLAVDNWEDAGELPPTKFDLVDSYLKRLCTKGSGNLRVEDFLDASKAVAQACVTADLAPRAIPLETAKNQIKTHQSEYRIQDGSGISPSLVLDQLVDSGLLQKLINIEATRVRFANDPIAELLIAAAANAPENQNESWVKVMWQRLDQLKDHSRSGLRDAMLEYRSTMFDVDSTQDET